jgi:hypothetical protein
MHQTKKKCKKCGSSVDKGLFVCPNCNSPDLIQNFIEKQVAYLKTGQRKKTANKLLRKILVGILISIVFIPAGKELAKRWAQSVYDADLQRQQSGYQNIQIDNTQETKNNFVNDEPYFTVNIPEGIKIEKFFDSDGVIAYQGNLGMITCQISIVDIYKMMNPSSANYARAQMDYNKYQKESMDAAYNGTIETVFKTMPYEEMVNREYAINKINNVIFIYIKFEIPDEEGDIVRISYDFLRNGYSIGIIGAYLKNNDEEEKIIKSYLNSIAFEQAKGRENSTN